MARAVIHGHFRPVRPFRCSTLCQQVGQVDNGRELQVLFTVYGHDLVCLTLLAGVARCEGGVSLVRVSPLSDWYVVQQRRVLGHVTRRTLIFRFKSMGEDKWTAGQGHEGRTCPL